MPPVDEFQYLVQLLGVPDVVLVEGIQGDYSFGYALRFLYPTRGLEVSYFENAEELVLDGKQTTVMCLGKATSRTAYFYLSPYIGSLSYENDPANLAAYLGLSNEEFIKRIMAPQACISI
jgi:hypothetical protein